MRTRTRRRRRRRGEQEEEEEQEQEQKEQKQEEPSHGARAHSCRTAPPLPLLLMAQGPACNERLFCICLRPVCGAGLEAHTLWARLAQKETSTRDLRAMDR